RATCVPTFFTAATSVRSARSPRRYGMLYWPKTIWHALQAKELTRNYSAGGGPKLGKSELDVWECGECALRYRIRFALVTMQTRDGAQPRSCAASSDRDPSGRAIIPRGRSFITFVGSSRAPRPHRSF